MITRITEEELIRQAIDLAVRTRRQIEAAGLHITDFERIAELFRVTVLFVERPEGEDGAYLDDLRQIVISTKVKNEERINFTFLHELMHSLIQDDPDLLSACHDVPGGFSDELIERLCNKGAAEMLVPSEALRQYGCSVALIPTLCEQFSASSLAVAFQMINCATHSCYMFIAEKRLKVFDSAQLTFYETQSNGGWHLWVTYSASSSATSYKMGRNYAVSPGHIMYKALAELGKPINGRDDIPRRNTKPWIADCECLAYNGWVFTLFHVSHPISSAQLKLFGE